MSGGVANCQSLPITRRQRIMFKPRFKILAKILFAASLMFAGCVGTAANISMPPTGSAVEPVPTTILKPEGAGPFPAVVIMHDCSGLGPRSSGAPMRWARQLVGQGFVVAMPDSFTPRGHADGVCTNPSPSRNEVAPARRVADGYATLAQLRTLPYVDAARIGIMGSSHGGSTTLFSMVAPERDNEPLAEAKRNGFAAAIAFYPSCLGQIGAWSTVRKVSRGAVVTSYLGVYRPLAPLLILIGDLDDWTPAEPCEKLTENARQAGYPVTIKVYPGAHHAFDNNGPIRYVPERVNVNAPSGRGATTGGNREAWDDSVRQVQRFFAQHLTRPGN